MSRNPSRPMPVVRNQFRPVSNWIGYICDETSCSVDPRHVMKSQKLYRHLQKCENNDVKKENKCDEDRLQKCPYDSLHRFPAGKQDEHFRECKTRAAEIMARLEAGESCDDIDNRFAYKTPSRNTEPNKV